MSLHVDPEITLRMLKSKQFDKKTSRREVNNLIAEVSSGVYTLEQLGIKSINYLRRFIR